MTLDNIAATLDGNQVKMYKTNTFLICKITSVFEEEFFSKKIFFNDVNYHIET